MFNKTTTFPVALVLEVAKGYQQEPWRSTSGLAVIIVRGKPHFLCLTRHLADFGLASNFAGDSQAVLSRGGSAVPLSIVHSPNVRSERQRIEEAGGYVRMVCAANHISISYVVSCDRASCPLCLA